LCTLRQGSHLVAGPGRIGICEMLAVDFVDVAKARQVGQQNRRLERRGYICSECLGNRSEVTQALVHLLAWVLGVELTRCRVERKLPGDIEEVLENPCM